MSVRRAACIQCIGGRGEVVQAHRDFLVDVIGYPYSTVLYIHT